jgi:DHA1 family bicyclomycin/chloramphenicol resistance-like MFS transporter
MGDASVDQADKAHEPMTATEFVAVIGCLMALTALTTDLMLPALPEIGSAFAVAADNDRQSVIAIFLFGFGLGQFIAGPISDSFGRRPILLIGLLLYIGSSALCVIATDFETLILARFLQGLAAAAPRVMTVSIVRDCYSGPRMARVMSLALMLMIAVPVLAPTLGQAILLVAPWRAMFIVLLIYGVVLAIWIATRLPETLATTLQRPFSLAQTSAAIIACTTNRQTLGYALACGVMYGTLFAFVLSAQQILGEMFGLGTSFPLVFGSLALGTALTSFLNAALVQRLGLRTLSHAAVVVFLLLSLGLFGLAQADALTLPAFLLLVAGCMASLGLVFANLNTLAMEPQGHVAGTASSLLGATTTIIASIIGHVIGQAYDGTALPLAMGFVACSATAVVILLVTERGKFLDRHLAR